MCRVGVFDSGIGGLTVIEELKKELPKEDFLFYEDSLNNPYGEKDNETIKKIVENIVEYLIGQGCKIIVIACNTVTTVRISYLRNKYKNIVFIGTEPAIKLACDKGYENVLVMATPATIASERVNVLITNSKKDFENIYLVPCDGLANAIEVGDILRQEELIHSIYESYNDKNINAIVLGCTHYPMAKKIITKYFKNADLLDGSNGVARECKRQMLLHNLITNKGNGDVLIINSKDR